MAKSTKKNGEKKPKPIRLELTAGEALRASDRAAQLAHAESELQRCQGNWHALVAVALKDRGKEIPDYACIGRIDVKEETDEVALVIEPV